MQQSFVKVKYIIELSTIQVIHERLHCTLELTVLLQYLDSSCMFYS